MLKICVQILLVTLLFLLSSSAMAEKTDVIYLKNGDRVTGEIKTLLRGKLTVNTDHMGNIAIEWDDILEIVSKTGQSVELTDGKRLYGPLTKPENTDLLVIKTEDGPKVVDTLEVVAMYPVATTFWERLDITASLGFSWDKGSDVGKYNFGIDTINRRIESMTRTKFSTEVTTQAAANDTSRSLLDANHTVFLENKRFRSYFGNLERNQELGLDLRAIAGVGYGWIPVRSQSGWFSMAAGMNVNHEIPNAGTAETNIEAAGLITYEYYKYSTPERSFRVNLQVFPSLTDFGRWRSTFSTDFRFEIFDDLFWKLDFYANYDSSPLSIEGSSSDYGVNSSVAYKF